MAGRIQSGKIREGGLKGEIKKIKDTRKQGRRRWLDCNIYRLLYNYYHYIIQYLYVFLK